MAGRGAESAAGDDGSLATGDCVFIKSGRVQIPPHFGEIPETELVGSVRAVPHTRLLHANLLKLIDRRTAKAARAPSI
jgi:hypothetical protein